MTNADEYSGESAVIGDASQVRTASPEESALMHYLSETLISGQVRIEDVFLIEEPQRCLRVLILSQVVSAQGLSLDQIAEASREISEALDRSDLMGDLPYELEVSTPGVSRPMTHRHHFERAVGRWLKITTLNKEKIEGRLLEVLDDGVRIQGHRPAPKGVKPKLLDPVSIEFSTIKNAKVDVEFSAVDADTQVEEA